MWFCLKPIENKAVILRNLLKKIRPQLNHIPIFREKNKIRQFFWNLPDGLQEEHHSGNETFRSVQSPLFLWMNASLTIEPFGFQREENGFQVLSPSQYPWHNLVCCQHFRPHPWLIMRQSCCMNDKVTGWPFGFLCVWFHFHIDKSTVDLMYLS